MRFILGLGMTALLLCPSVADARCFKNGANSYCFDSWGNGVTVHRSGKDVAVSGVNVETGSMWSRSTRHQGDTVYHNGYSSDRGAWSFTERYQGNRATFSGWDTNGNVFIKQCGPLGCF